MYVLYFILLSFATTKSSDNEVVRILVYRNESRPLLFIFSEMAKLIVRNLSDFVEGDALRALFEQRGDITECGIIKDFSFAVRNNEDN